MDHGAISPEDGGRLLRLARQTAEAHVRGLALPPPLDIHKAPFNEYRGLFVTFRVDGNLRGCMGAFHADQPLGALVQEIALNSLADPRFIFNRIGSAELQRLHVEVSILSPMKRSRDPLAELVPGVHGVLIRLGGRGGCFLPQVATEMGWDGRQMLEQCCSHKAGLPASAWQDPSAEVYLFTAQIFSEPLPDGTGE